MNILVLNSGSSSLKFQIIDINITAGGEIEASYLAKGLIEASISPPAVILISII